MPAKFHVHPSDLRGLSRLTIDGIGGVTRLVEDLHDSIARTPRVFGGPMTWPVTAITRLVYRSIRGVTSLVGGTLDATLARLIPLLGEPRSTREREAVMAALNGVLGDYLAETQNPLAIPMRLRRDGHPLKLETPAKPTGKLLLLVHGLCMNDLQWSRPRSEQEPDQDLASILARDLGYTPVYLHYNSGRHISSNGRELADLLEALVRPWPAPVEELAIVAHSMGGLVTRSACHYGAAAGHDWLRHLRQIVFFATPHHGAPLERGGNWVDMILGAYRYSAPFVRLGKIRSAGITDLRYGNLLDEDWEGRDRFARSGDRRRPVPLPEGVQCSVIAATSGKQAGDLGDRLLGDGLVPLESALGRHDDPSLSLPFPESRQWIGHGLNHLELLTHPAAHDQVISWLGGSSAA